MGKMDSKIVDLVIHRASDGGARGEAGTGREETDITWSKMKCGEM